EQLQADDKIQDAIGGAELAMRLEEPVGHDAVLGHAIEDAVGTDDGRVRRAGQDQKADDDDESVEGQAQRLGADDVHGQAADEVLRILGAAQVFGNEQDGQEADAGGEDEAIDEDDE